MNNTTANASDSAENYLHTTALFGEVKRTVITKDFKGGTISNLFGATEIDFSYADLHGIAILDISQAFGETKLIVPRDWRVQAHVSHFCSTIDDARRYFTQTNNTDKILIVKGWSVFAVVDVFSF
jgi:predicted membrane protein